MPDSATQSPAGRHGRAAFYFIFITITLDFLGFGIIAPVLPKLIIQFEGGNIARAAAIVGYFGFGWGAMQFLFSPILGAWSDRFGRRPVILLSCVGLGLDYILMAVSPTLGWLFLGRIISGITSSNISSAFAYVTDVTPPEGRAKKFGWLSAAFGLGFIIGPAAGGVLGGIHLRLPFWVAAGLSLANALYGFFILPESLPPERRAKSAWHMANPLGSLTLLASKPGLAILGFITTLNYLGQQSLPSIFVLYVDYRYGWSERMIGFSLAVVGVSVSVVSGGLVGPFVKRFGERGGLLFGLLIGAVAFCGFGLASHAWILFAAIPLLALWGISGPAVQSLMTQHVDPTSQGKLQGAINSIRGFTTMFGPLLFTQVLAAAISPSLGLHLPGAPYFLAGFFLFSSALLAVYATRPSSLPSAPKPAASLTPSD
jgi:MFS transporter, DHA1 family, tetracycline resistance protein